ncbi:hypothetical protein BSKO_13567 [Bryopsis sp. KO-2023]|nr:hypothetical protein BSKO_13567 [Bryopsis sp. KO-2023]
MLRRRGSQFLSLLSRRAASSDAPPGVGVTSGIPVGTYKRKATIYSPARVAGQQGLAQTVWGHAPSWKIDFENTAKWENPLMGWTSTADPLENTFRTEAVAFYNKEEAIEFCKKHGWPYEVIDYNERKIDRTKRFSQYGDNFSVKRSGMPDLSTFRSNQPAASNQTAAPAAKPQKNVPKKGKSPAKK